MLRVLLALGMTLGVAGCMESRPQLSDSDVCVSYGAQPGSQNYFNCMLAKDQQRQANNAMLAGVILSRPQPQPYILPMPRGY
jgi:hypothetical protein